MYSSEPLHPSHAVASFDSGQSLLDDWLRRHALTAEAKRVGRTFVWVDQARVVAYYTLSAHLLERVTVPRRLGRGDPEQIPAMLLARLALSRELRGRNLGPVLLADALHRMLRAGDEVAARYVVVDAIDEQAAAFYRRHGFMPTAVSTRLVRKLSAIADDLA